MALRRCSRRGIVGVISVDALSRVAGFSTVKESGISASRGTSHSFSELASGFQGLLRRNCAQFSTSTSPRPLAFTAPSLARNAGKEEAELVAKKLGSLNLLGFQKQAQQLLGRRGVATETLSDRWKLTTERIKQAVLEKPRAVVESVKQSEFVAGTKDAASTLSKPVARSLMSYREAAKLQLEAFWRRNYLIVVGAAGLAACLLLWRIMFGVASMFVSLSEGMAKYGFLALAASMVAFGGLMVKARYTINPDAVYRIAMRKLNTSADVLKVLGAPLSGTDIRAYVMTGGGLRIKDFKPRLSSKRCFLIFPIQGSDRRGLVNIETKKKDGQYDFKLLAVDVAGRDERIYVVGDEVEYKIGGGLIAELRDPIVKAMAAQQEFEAQDDKEEEQKVSSG